MTKHGLMYFGSGTQWPNCILSGPGLLQSFSSWVANHFSWLAGYH